ncbi:MAG: hypothetical protein RIS85_1647 [Pseudomonadota bacterium]|jgi:DNA-binding response OmpR family regulator
MCCRRRAQQVIGTGVEEWNSKPQPDRQQHVLVVEDGVLVAMAIEDVLIERGFTVSVATTLAEADTMIAAQKPAAALLDLQLPDGLSVHLARRLQDNGCAVALCSAFDASDVPEADDFSARFTKPVSPDILADWAIAALTPDHR